MFVLPQMNIPAHQRLERLTAVLHEQGTIQVSAFAAEWGVSEMTVRRDLARLEEQGLVNRVHGGAVVSGGLRFQTRLDHHRREKRKTIAKLAASIPDEGCVYLDGSTTIYQLIDSIAKKMGLSVATNNVDTFHAIAKLPGISAVLIGGVLNEATDNLVGPMARRSIEGLSFAAAYTSAYALDPELGPCEPAAEDAEVKELVARRSRAVYVAVNQHKLGRYASATWQWNAEMTTLATDLNPSSKRLDPYRTLVSEIL